MINYVGGIDINIDKISSLVISYGIRILISIIIFLIGLKLIKKVIAILNNKLPRVGFDKSVSLFLLSLIKAALEIMLVISIAAILGAEMTSFVAILGSAGIAVGLALQGSLSNFAGGILILVLKPFKVGDFIRTMEYEGFVERIQIFYTTLETRDNRKIIIPNANLSNSSTINYTANPIRRVDLTLSVGYDDDILLVREVLFKLAKEHALVLEEPMPKVFLGEHGDSALNFLLWVWCKTEDYWDVYYELLEKAKLEFDREGINIPYPQLDVHFKDKILRSSE